MAYVPTFGAGDALAQQTVNDLKVFTDWLTANNQANKGIVTEFGIPGSSQAATDPIPGSGTGAKFDPRWENVMQQWFEMANRQNLSVTAWNASEWRVDLRAYQTDDGNNKILNYRTNVSSVLENNLGSGTAYYRGVNYAGAEFSDYGPGGVLNRSHFTEPGAGYYYPTAGSFALLAGRGMILQRIPVRWERLQPTLKGPLDTAEMNALMVSITAANNAGCKVLLDIHNYARYDTVADGSGGGVYILGQNAPATHRGQAVGGTMIDCFADLWSKLATYFKNGTPIWGYDICNEPHDCPNGVSDWQAASRAAVEAIRAVDQNVIITVEGYSYATIPNWTSTNGSTPWLTEIIPTGQTNAGQARNTDPKILWNGHHYPDPATNGNDGGFQDTYDTELTNAQNKGYAAWTTSGYTAPATNNSNQTGVRTVFKSTFDSQGDFSGTYDSVVSGSNTLTFPASDVTSLGNTMKVATTATSDTGGASKSLTGSVFRNYSVDFYLPSSASVSTTGSYTISHMWRDNNSTDLVELRILGTTGGFLAGLTIPSGSYTFVNSGNTVNNLGAKHTFKVVLSDSDIKLFVDGSNTAEATITGSFSGVNMGGFFVGKFYSTSYIGNMYFDNVACSNNATYYAPPNGGQMTYTAPVTGTTNNLLDFLCPFI